MENMSVLEMRNFVIWIAWAVGGALLLGGVIPLMRGGVRKNDPSVGAGLFAVAFTVAAIVVAALKGVLVTVWSLDNATLLRLIGCGALSAFTWLCLYTALTGGTASRVLPMVNLSSVLLPVAGYFLFNETLGLWRLCCLILILLGTVLMESHSGTKGILFMVYGGLAAVFYAGTTLIKRMYLTDVDPAVIEIGRGLGAAVLLWIFVIVRGKQRTLNRITLRGWLCPTLAGLCCLGSQFLWYLSALRGDSSMLSPVTLVSFAAALLFARIGLKERLKGSAVFGAILTMLGMFAILMGLS